MPKKKWYEFLPPWISATSALIATTVGLWVLFFSPASKALVDYLQSEITARNNRIVILETREKELQVSVSSRKDELKSLGHQRDLLQQQIVKSEAERNDLVARVDKIRSDLSQTEFLLVKAEIATTLAGTIGNLLPIGVIDEAGSEKGTRPRHEELWTGQLGYIRSVVEKLPDKDKSLGRVVVQNFIEQCGHLSKTFVDIPALKSPRFISSADDYQRDEKLFTQKLNAIIENFHSAQTEIDTCFKAVEQK